MTTSLMHLDKSKREQLIKEIKNMEMFDELTYTIDDDGATRNYLVKLNPGYLFKAKFSSNYVYVPEIDFI